MANILSKSKFILFLYNLTFFQRWVISFVIFLVFSAFFYTALLRPLENSLQENRLLLDDFYKKKETLDLVLANSDLLLKELQELDNVKLYEKNKFDVVSDLIKYSLNYLNFKVLSKIKKDSYKGKVYELKLGGHFNNFISFFNNRLINHPLLKIKALEIQYLSEEGIVFTIKFRLLKFLYGKNK